MNTAMKRHRHSPEQALRKVREGERLLNEGTDLTEVLRHLEISEATWNRWRAQYAGMKGEEMRRLRELEAENTRLKKIVADLSLDNDMLKEVAKGIIGWSKTIAGSSNATTRCAALAPLTRRPAFALPTTNCVTISVIANT